MGLLSSHYKFYIQFTEGINTEVFPINSELQFEWEYHTELRTWRHALKTELEFRNTDGHATFEALAAKKAQPDKCFIIPIKIHVSYDGVIYAEKWAGTIPLNEGEWNFSTCSVKLRLRIDDVFKCILDNWKDEVNLLDIENKYTIKTIEGEKICQDVETRDGNAPVPPAGEGWTLIRRYKFNWFIAFNLSGNLHPIYKDEYCRIKYTGEEEEPSGFILDELDGLYYAFVPTGARKFRAATPDDIVDILGEIEVTPPTGSTPVRGLWTVTEWPEVVFVDIDNGLQASDVLNHFFDGVCDITWCSDFFGINPIGDAPDNGAYQYATQYLQELLFIQASDVVRANNEEFNNATKFLISFQKFWENIRMLQLELIDDKVNNCLRIEHISFREDSYMLDLTIDRYAANVEGMAQYTQDKRDYPKIETFHFKYETGNIDFDRVFITYNSDCTNNESDNEKKYSMPETVTDVGYLYNNVDIQDDIEKMRAMAIVSTTGGVINSSFGRLQGIDLLNGPMAWSNLVQALYLWKRPLRNGLINGVPNTFLSLDRLKKQPKIGIKMSLEDYYDNFNPADLVKTHDDFGWGEIRSVNFKFPESFLEIELGYE